MVAVGDSIPSVLLEEKTPGETVDLSKELATGDGLIIFVPAAFSPTCSDSHIPAYIVHDKLSSAGKVFVVSVNDAFVMNAWKNSLSKQFSESSIRFLADASGAFTRAVDLEFPAAPLLGTNRAKRGVLVTKDGKVVKAEIEPDNVGHTVSSAENILG